VLDNMGRTNKALAANTPQIQIMDFVGQWRANRDAIDGPLRARGRACLVVKGRLPQRAKPDFLRALTNPKGTK
jgi:hypothetical protein